MADKSAKYKGSGPVSIGSNNPGYNPRNNPVLNNQGGADSPNQFVEGQQVYQGNQAQYAPGEGQPYEVPPQVHYGQPAPNQGQLVAEQIQVPQARQGIPINGFSSLFGFGGPPAQGGGGQGGMQGFQPGYDQNYEQLTLCPKCCAIVYIIFMAFTLFTIIPQVASTDGCNYGIISGVFQIAYAIYFIIALIVFFRAIKARSVLHLLKAQRLFKSLFVLTAIQSVLLILFYIQCQTNSTGLAVLYGVLTFALQELVIYYFHFNTTRLIQYLQIAH